MQDIQAMPENVEQIRERIRKMSDLELHGHAAKKPRHIFAFLAFVLSTAFALSTPAQTQTARDYYNELKVANALNEYRDQYVCFADDDAPSFAVIARAADVIREMKKTGAVIEAKQIEQSSFKDGLFLHTYYKGVPSAPFIYEAISTEGTEYKIEFGSPFHGKMVYTINWDTGRYRLRVYALDHSKTVPTAEKFGKCELIHPL